MARVTTGSSRKVATCLSLFIFLLTALGLGAGELKAFWGRWEATAQSRQEKSPAERTYVAPGDHDEYYMFSSGGHSGNVLVFGIPSMRLIRTIPVFTPESASGYGFDERTREMLGGYRWGDVHHVALSETEGRYDGRWLYANDNANNRVAMINLKTFEVEQILGPLPNAMGTHCAAFITPNSEYLFLPTRFATTVPVGSYAPLSEFSEKYWGYMSAIGIDPQTGHMELSWQLKLPPWSYDLSDAGKLVSDGWAFLTTYNTEEATERLEINASQNDRDYLVAVDWRAAEQAVAAGQYVVEDGARVLDPAQVPGIVYLIPLAKSPHGVDVSPDGRWIVGSGKLSPTVTVYDFFKIQEAIENGRVVDHVRGLPVLDEESVRAAQVPVGLGPLHTVFDDKGHGYTSLFLESAVAKWELGTWEVKDKIQIHYNTGHMASTEGDTVSPTGHYAVSLNKLSKDRFLPVGPAYPENLQLIDISGDKMELLYDAPVNPEPHYAQIIRADRIQPLSVYPRDESRPNSVWRPQDARIERDGNLVTVYAVAVRSRFVPDVVEVNQGDRVRIHLTNIDEEPDITHGFGISLYNINVEVAPGQTKTIEFVADKPGVYPYYCTNFCSALHQEMQGWLLVKPVD